MYFVMQKLEANITVNKLKLHHTIIKYPIMKIENVFKLNRVEVNTD